MKTLILLVGLILSVTAWAAIPHSPEADSRFTSIESNVTTLQSNVTTLQGYTPSHYIYKAGTTDSETDINATITVSSTGIAATDVAIATVSGSASGVYVLKAVPSANTLTITLSGNGGAGTSVHYTILRSK